MLSGIIKNYLWIGLVAAFALGPVRQATGTEVFVLASAGHLALIALALWVSGAAKGPAGRGGGHAAFLPGVLLVSGPIVLFMGATTGPPTPAHPGDYLFNTTGLLLGLVVVLLGFGLLSARLWEQGERTWSVLGFIGLLVGVVLYALNMIFRYAQIAAGAAAPFVEVERQVFPGLGNISLPLGTEPSWPAFVWVLFTLMLAAYAVSAYFASAAYGAALLRAGWIGKAAGTSFAGIGLALALVTGTGWLFLSNQVVETLLFFLGVPFLTVVLPYFLGVVLVRRSATEQRTGRETSPEQEALV